MTLGKPLEPRVNGVVSRPAKLEDLFLVQHRVEKTVGAFGETVVKPPPLFLPGKTEAPEPHVKTVLASVNGDSKAFATTDGLNNATTTTTITTILAAMSPSHGVKGGALDVESIAVANPKGQPVANTNAQAKTTVQHSETPAPTETTRTTTAAAATMLAITVAPTTSPPTTLASTLAVTSKSAQVSAAKSPAALMKKFTPRKANDPPIAPSKEWAQKSTLSSLLHLTQRNKIVPSTPPVPVSLPNYANVIPSASQQIIARAKKRTEIKGPSSSTLLPVDRSSSTNSVTTVRVVVSNETEAVVQIPRTALLPGGRSSTSETTLLSTHPETVLLSAQKKAVSIALRAPPDHQLPVTTNGTNTNKAAKLDETSRAPKKLLLRRIEEDAGESNSDKNQEELALIGGIFAQMKVSSTKTQDDEAGALVQTITGTELSENSLVELEHDALLSPVTWASTCRASEKASLSAQRKAKYDEDILLCDLGLLDSVVEQVESSPVTSYREVHTAPFLISVERFQKEVVPLFFKNVVAKKDGNRALCADLKKLQPANHYELKVAGLAKLVKQFRPFFWEWWFSEVDRMKAEALPRREKALARKSVITSEKQRVSSLRNRGYDHTSFVGGLVLTPSVDSSTTLEEDNSKSAPPPAKTAAKVALGALRVSLPPPVAVTGVSTATLDGETGPEASSRGGLLVPPTVPSDDGPEESTQADAASNTTLNIDTRGISGQKMIAVNELSLVTEETKEKMPEALAIITKYAEKESPTLCSSPGTSPLTTSTSVTSELVAMSRPQPLATTLATGGATVSETQNTSRHQPRDPSESETTSSAKDRTAKVNTPSTTNDSETTMDGSSFGASDCTMTPAVMYSEKATCSDATGKLIVRKPRSLPVSLPTGDSSKEIKRSFATSFHVDFDPREPLPMSVSSHNQDTVCIVKSMEPSFDKHPELRPGTKIEAADMVEDFSINNSIKVESHRDLKLVYVRAAHTPVIKKIRIWFTNDNKDLDYIGKSTDGEWNGNLNQVFKQEPLAVFQQTTAESSKEFTAKETQKTKKRVRFAETLYISNKRRRLEVAGKAFPTERRHVVGKKSSPMERFGAAGNTAPTVNTNINTKRLESTSTPEHFQHHLLSFLRAASSVTNEWKNQRAVEVQFMTDLNLQSRDPLRVVRERATREGLVEWGRVFLSIGAVVKQGDKKEGYSEKSYMKLSQKGVTVLSVGNIKGEEEEVPAVKKFAVKSDFGRRETATTTTDIDIDPTWFVSGGSRKKCNYFVSARKCCLKAIRCQYLHVQPRLGHPLVDYPQMRTPNLNYHTVQFHEHVVRDTGEALFTCVHHDTETNIFYKPEGGQAKIFDGLRDIYWYQTKNQALQAVSRVFAASQLYPAQVIALMEKSVKREPVQTGYYYRPASAHRYSSYGPNTHL